MPAFPHQPGILGANYPGKRLAGSALFLIVLLLMLVLVAPMDSGAQMLASAVILSLMHFCSRLASAQVGLRHVFRIMALALGVALTLRYLFWRGIYTLDGDGLISLVFVLFLFAAEIYAGITHIIGCIVNVLPLSRPQLDLTDVSADDLPSVDVFIPSYNEDNQILEVTLLAALNMRYPQALKQVYLLDDGGTDQKVNQPDATAAQHAKTRRHELQSLCQRLGVEYRTRPKNEYAKAGNLNYTFAHTQGDLVVILDADHVPTADFLERTVPWMVRNKDVFLVQTPHFMANPDPIERNYFGAFERMPSENDMFYGTIQKGLDYWSSSFFCGSAAVLRRVHLQQVGGISGDSVTEDAETAYDLHSLGYRSVYVDRPMVSGLAPETFDGFIQQRSRWAQGMTQILLLKKPYRSKTLAWYQRLGYMSSILFWLFPFARIVFLLMPLAYLLFGLNIYRASLAEIAAFTLPHIIATYMVSTMLFGRTRWPMVSELYELLQCLFTFKALTKVFKNPRKPEFVVTPKGDTLEKQYISPMATPFYIVFALLSLGVVLGVWRWWFEPLTRELTLVVSLWNLFNLILMFGILSVLIEQRQVRSQPRLPSLERIRLQWVNGKISAGRLSDISVGGASADVASDTPVQAGDDVTLIGWSEAEQSDVRLPVKVLAIQRRPSIVQLRLRFTPQTMEQQKSVVGYTLGDSRRWVSFQNRRTRPIGYWRAFRHIVSVSIKPFMLHIAQIIKTALTKVRQERKQ